MEQNSIDLTTSKIANVETDDTTIRIIFEPAYILRTMTGAHEYSRWYQNGALVFEEAILISEPIADFPVICGGGDITENIYTYRDMMPLPLDSHGQVGCSLKLTDSDKTIEIQATKVRAEMIANAKYIEHTSSI